MRLLFAICLSICCCSLAIRNTFAADKEEADPAAKAAKELATAAAAAKAVLKLVMPAEPVGKVQVEAVPNDAEKAAAQEFQNRLKPILKQEIAFAVRMCQLDAAQQKTLGKVGDDVAEKTAKEMASAQVRGMQGQVVFVNGGRVAQPKAENASAREMLRSSLAEAIKTQFPEQSEKYTKEIASQESEKKQMIVDSLVAMIDKKLVLSAEQRAAIGKSMLEKWNESWVPQVQLFMYDYQFFPMIPDECVLPHLRESQRVAYRNVSKTTIRFGFDPFQNNILNNLGINFIQFEAN